MHAPVTGIRKRIESWFGSFADTVIRLRWLTVITCIIITVLLSSGMNRLRMDTSNESFFHADDPALIDYYDFRKQFGNDEYILVTLETDTPFTTEFLTILKSLHRDIEENVPYIDDVRSLANARNTYADGDTLVVEDMLETVPDTAADLRALKERVMGNPLLVNTVIARDEKLLTIAIQPQAFPGAAAPSGDAGDILGGFEDTTPAIAPQEDKISPAQISEMVAATEAVLAEYESDDVTIHLTGSPVFIEFLNRAITGDLARMVPLSLLLVIGFLAVLFRRISGVLLPLVVVFLSVLATMGAMGLIGVPVNNVTQIVPTFLIVVGIADAVHILAIFFRTFNTKGDKHAAIRTSLEHSGLAILMTSLTTAAGLASFIVADAKVISDLGIAAPIGVSFAFFFTITMLPATLAMFPIRRGKPTPHGNTLADRGLARLSEFSIRRYREIVIAGVVLLAICIIGVSQVRLSHAAIRWFPKDSEVRKVAEMVDTRLGGAVSLEFLIDTGSPYGLYDPAFLATLDDIEAWAVNQTDGEARVSKAVSVADVVKEINKALHEGRSEAYTLPGNRELLAQEFLLFESSGTDDLEDVTDGQFRVARLTLTIPNGDVVKYLSLLERIENRIRTDFPDADITATGLMSLFVRLITHLITTMLESYGIALVVITALMILLIGRIRIGLIAMIPNILPLLAILGTMGFTGITINLSTIIIGSIIMGLVVDDTIHFFHNYRRYHEETGNSDEAVRRTMATAGRAIIITSLVLAAGFYIYLLATMRTSVEYGFLTGTAVVFALAADLLLAPALMTLTDRLKKS